MTIFAQHNTATLRRDLRRKVRSALGTSRDSAPEFPMITTAVAAMQELVRTSSNGHFGLALIRQRDHKLVTPLDARRIYFNEEPDLSKQAVALSPQQIAELREALDYAPASMIQDWMLHKLYGEDPQEMVDQREGVNAVYDRFGDEVAAGLRQHGERREEVAAFIDKLPMKQKSRNRVHFYFGSKDGVAGDGTTYNTTYNTEARA